MLRMLFILLALFAGVPASAQPAGYAARIDRMLADETAADRFSGAILVGRGGKVLFAKAYGSADREWQIANTPDTRFRIASLTKSFTAALILKLEAQGKLKVTDSVCRHLEPCPEVWRPITLHHLLTHTSGLRNLQADPVEYFRRARLPTSPSLVLADFAAKPLDFQPGESTRYSNTGYVMLTAVIEKAGGQPYRTALKTAFFDPLGLTTMGYEAAFDLVPRRARGYVARNNVIGRADHIDMTVPAGAGGLYGSVGDLYRWSEALHAGRAIDGAAFARMSGRVGGPFGVMTEDGRSVTYAYGLESEPTRRGLNTFHYGSIDGFKTYLRRYGDDGLTVVVLANIQSVNAGALGDRAAAIVAGATVEELFAR
jgi:CubicO group peptidase (beta-lactamase class C family)